MGAGLLGLGASELVGAPDLGIEVQARRGCENEKPRSIKRPKRIVAMTVRYGRLAKITSLSQPCGDFEQGQVRA